jgi:GNAT superfamily N-acetyltransferase
MRLVPYHPGLLPDLTHLVNGHIRLVPPGWEVTEAQVTYVLSKSASLWHLHFRDDPIALETQETICVLEGDTLRAAAGWFHYNAGLDERRTSIAWMVSQPEYPRAQSLLLDSVIEHSRQAKSSHIETSRFAFGVGWMGIPLVWPHLIEGFNAAGFEITQKWVMMIGDTHISGNRPLPNITPFSTVWQINEHVLEWVLEAYSGQDQIADCESWGIPPHFQDCPGYDEWTTIEWLGVEGDYQRRGVGAYLMQEQLRFQAGRRVQHVIVWTNTDNFRIQNLNKAFGFTYGPECHVFEKSLA